MSILGAYVDWQRDTETSPGLYGYITAYVKIDAMPQTNPPDSNLLILADFLANQSALLNPLVLMETHDREILNTLIAAGTGLTDPVFSFLYLNENLAGNLTLPAAIAGFVTIIYIGSSLNVSPVSSGVPENRGPITPVDGEPVFGVIDDGFGFLNSRFTEPGDGEEINSRFIALWLQGRDKLGIDSGGSTTLRSGVVLESSMISSVLNAHKENRYEPDWYKTLNDLIFPPVPAPRRTQTHRGNAFAASHGTHVLDLACGADVNDVADPMRGVKIVGVQMPPDSIESTAGKRLEINILQAVRWIIFRAFRFMQDTRGGSQPLVINISLGVTAGAKNGTGLLETYIKQEMELFNFLTGNAGIEVILAFGNDQRTNQVGEIKIPSGGASWQSLQWRVQPDDRSASYLEIRPASEALKIRVTPAGETTAAATLPLLAPGDSMDILITPTLVGRLYREPDYLLSDPLNRPVYILAIQATGGYRQLSTGDLAPLAPAGVWTIELANADPAALDQIVSVQVQRGDTPIGYRQHGRQSYLFDADGYALDGTTRNWEEPQPGAIVTRQSTHSAIASAATTVSHIAILTVGASYQSKRTNQTDLKETRYTGLGSTGAVLKVPVAPDFCADGDDSHMMTGVLASGTLTGTTRRLSGTSVSAPQVARWRLVALSPGMSSLSPASEVVVAGVTPPLDQILGQARVTTAQGRRDAGIVVSP